jgi:hypothetical protein
MLELGKIIRELIEAKKKKESRNTLENCLPEDKPEAESKCKRSLATIRRRDGQSLNANWLK